MILLTIAALCSCNGDKSTDASIIVQSDFCTINASTIERVCASYQCLGIDCKDNNGKINYTMTLDSKLVGDYFRPEFIASMLGLAVTKQVVESDMMFDSLGIDIKVKEIKYPYTYGYKYIKFVHDSHLTVSKFADNLLANDFESAIGLMDKDLILAEGEQTLVEFAKSLNSDNSLESYEFAGFQSANDVVVIYLVLVDKKQEFVTCKFNFKLSSSKSIIGIGFL